MNIQLMKVLIAVLAVLTLTTSLPYEDKISLLNSLEVGRNEDPMQWQCAGCDQDTKPIHSYVIEEPVQDVRAILSVYEEYTVLSFRYTATIKNVFQDILYAFQTQDQNSCEGCKVQKQYDKMWNSIRNYTLEELKKYNHTPRLIITGISLGGGLAVLSYVDIVHAQIFDNIQIITFGAPRVGNKKWALWFDDLTKQTVSKRFFLKGDPIAVLPICLTLLCNYRQTGSPIVCTKNLQTCIASQNEQITATEQVKDFGNLLYQSALEHIKEQNDDEYGGILDHIFEYKNVQNYELIE